MHLLFILTNGLTIFFRNVTRFNFAGGQFEVVFELTGQTPDVVAIATETGQNAAALAAHEVYAVESRTEPVPWSTDINYLLFSDGTHDRALLYVSGDEHAFYVRPDETAVIGSEAQDVVGVWDVSGARVMQRMLENDGGDYESQVRTMHELRGIEPPADLAQLSPYERETW
jgi:hypothetical protein